jgi:hypothetical protein
VYKLDSFVGFIGDEQVHAQECYDGYMLVNFTRLGESQSYHMVTNVVNLFITSIYCLVHVAISYLELKFRGIFF